MFMLFFNCKPWKDMFFCGRGEHPCFKPWMGWDGSDIDFKRQKKTSKKWYICILVLPLSQSVLSARVLDLVTSVLCLPWRDTGAGENVLICRFCQNYPNSPVSWPQHPAHFASLRTTQALPVCLKAAKSSISTEIITNADQNIVAAINMVQHQV